MKKLFYKVYSYFTGKNSVNTPTSLILEQMSEQRPLPIGRTQFMEWSDRIISGAGVEVEIESQRFALAETILHLPPGQSFSDDKFFIHRLRRTAVNQTCLTLITELKEAHKEKQELEQASKNALETLNKVDNKLDKIKEIMDERQGISKTTENMESKT